MDTGWLYLPGFTLTFFFFFFLVEQKRLFFFCSCLTLFDFFSLSLSSFLPRDGGTLSDAARGCRSPGWSEQGVRGARDRPHPSPLWCHCYHGDSTPRPEALPSPAGVWGGCLRCYHTLPTPTPPSIFEMPPPFSPTVLSLSHHPVPFPSELTAICALRNTPHLFLPSTFLLCILTCRMLPRGVLQLFHVADPPNKPTLVHRPPPILFDKISSEGGAPHGRIFVDLVLNPQNWLHCTCKGWKLWLLILIHSVTGVISTELS